MRVTRALGPLVVLATIGLTSPHALQGTLQGEVVGHSVSVSEGGAVIEFERADGSTLTIEVADGSVLINGNNVGTYRVNGPLEQSLRGLLSQAGRLSSEELLTAVQAWQVEGLAEQEAQLQEALESELSTLEVAAAAQAAAQEAAIAVAVEAAQDVAIAVAAEAAQEAAAEPEVASDIVIDLSSILESEGIAAQLDQVRDQLGEIENLGLNVENAHVRVGDLTVGRGRVIEGNLMVLSGDVSVFGRIEGNLMALEGDVILHRGGEVTGDVVSLNGRVHRGGGRVGGSVRSFSTDKLARLERVAGIGQAERRLSALEQLGRNTGTLLGTFIALACMGFGFTFFMPRQLEVVSGTVTESFGRSFLVGLFAQPLLLPLFAMMVVGLAITVIGIVVIPVAIIGFVLAVIATGIGGYLAAAKAVGGTYLTRRMAQGHDVLDTPYRSMFYGLMGLLAIWIPAGVLGWIPLVGSLLAVVAGILTWAIATAGFGAAILSRAGLRATFVRPGAPAALTDEHYWPSDEGTPTAPRTRRRLDP